jgi:hypothetical protein
MECGDSVATFVKPGTREQVAKELSKAVGRDARLYLIGKRKDGQTVGGFVAGKRKPAPWSGFAAPAIEAAEEE